MNRMLLVFAMMATIGTATAPNAQTAIAGDQTPFTFQFEQTASPRGVAIEGWVTNTLPPIVRRAEWTTRQADS